MLILRDPETRPAHAGDIPQLRALLSELYRTTYGPLLGPQRAAALHERWHAADRLHAQIDASGGSFLVAADCNQIIGHAFASAPNPAVLFIARLYVAETHQRRGIGTRLLRTAVDRHPACQVARLFVVQGNDAALSFYARRGFTIAGEAEQDGVRSLRLERQLPL